MEWLSNQWAIGTGGAVISGLLVMLVIRHLFAGRDQRDYQQNLATANSEILYAIRPAIAQKVIPSNAMLDALFSATARKYGVDSRDLLPKSGFANELMKEVIDNPYLSSQQKVEFCELMAGMKHPEMDASPKRDVEIVTVRADAPEPGAILGLTTALTVFMMTVFFYMMDKEQFLIGGQLLKFLPVLAVVFIIPIIAFLLLDLMRHVARPRPGFEGEKIAAPMTAAPAPGNRDLAQLEGRPIPSTP